MNIEFVTAAADAVAAIAVVVSLVYLGRQIHISNVQSQAAARYSFLDAYGAGSPRRLFPNYGPAENQPTIARHQNSVYLQHPGQPLQGAR